MRVPQPMNLEPASVAKPYTGYALPLAAFAALMSFVQMSLIGGSLLFGGGVRSPIGSGMIYAVLAFGFGLLGLFLVGLIILGATTGYFGHRK